MNINDVSDLINYIKYGNNNKLSLIGGGIVEHYKYDEINQGLTHEFKVLVTQEMQDSFREISGDDNPLHRDRNFANEKGFPDIVVFGMLTASFYSRLVGMYLPGERCLFHSINTSFKKPVYIGDELSVSGSVKEKRDLFKQIVISASIINQNKEKVSKATITVGVMDE